MRIFLYNLKQYLKLSFFLKFKKKYKRIFFLDQITKQYILKNNVDTKSLDIGCGLNPKNPFDAKNLYGVDLRDDLSLGFEIKKANLIIEKLPYPSNHFDYVSAFDFIEHIPRIINYKGENKYPFIELMNEIYRVLKPNGIFLHQTPAFPSGLVFQDPTHVNIITENTFPSYFCSPNVEAKKNGYGFTGNFELIEQRWFHKNWIIGLMKAKKV